MALIVDFDTLESGYRGCKKWPWFFWSNSKKSLFMASKTTWIYSPSLVIGQSRFVPLNKMSTDLERKRDTFRVTLISAINHQFQFFSDQSHFLHHCAKVIETFWIFFAQLPVVKVPPSFFSVPCDPYNQYWALAKKEPIDCCVGVHKNR